VTVLVSTHYMDEAVRCHRLCMMRRGRLVATGRPAELTAALDGRVVEVEAASPENAIAALRGRPEVASVTQLGNSVHVLLRRGAPAAATMAPRLAEFLRGVVAAPAARTADATLEDVFVALSLGEMAAAEEARQA
jgi:ABC-2 type transport system ATP-binding protein